MTPLHDAAKKGDVAAVLELLEQGAEVDARDKARRLPLHVAEEGNHLAVARVLREWRRWKRWLTQWRAGLSGGPSRIY